MSRRILQSLCLMLVAVFSLTTGCSDDPTAPPSPVYQGIVGTVTDAAGLPLAGVSVGLRYDIPGAIQDTQLMVIGAGAEKSALQIRYDLPEVAPVHLWITDRAGDFVVTLIDRDLPAGVHSVAWSGEDQNGEPVGAGLYHYHLQRGEEEPTSHRMFLLYLSPSEFLRAPNAVTDAAGVYRIPMNLVAVGETFEGVDELGESQGEYRVSDVFRIVAVREGDPSPVWAERVVDFSPGAVNRRPNLILQ